MIVFLLSKSTLWYNHGFEQICLLILTGFTGERCGPWASFFFFFFVWVFLLAFEVNQFPWNWKRPLGAISAVWILLLFTWLWRVQKLRINIILPFHPNTLTSAIFCNMRYIVRSWTLRIFHLSNWIKSGSVTQKFRIKVALCEGFALKSLKEF